MENAQETPGRDGTPRHRLDWRRRGLSASTERVAYAVLEAIMSDEDDEGRLVPGPAEMCTRAVGVLGDTVGRGSPDLRRGFAVLAFLMEWLPLFVIGRASRASNLPLDRRVAYLEALESSRIGWLSMLFVAFKVPMCIPAFEEGEELATTGIDRPDTVARRVLPVTMGETPKPPAQPVSMGETPKPPAQPVTPSRTGALA